MDLVQLIMGESLQPQPRGHRRPEGHIHLRVQERNPAPRTIIMDLVQLIMHDRRRLNTPDLQLLHDHLQVRDLNLASQGHILVLAHILTRDHRLLQFRVPPEGHVHLRVQDQSPANQKHIPGLVQLPMRDLRQPLHDHLRAREKSLVPPLLRMLLQPRRQDTDVTVLQLDPRQRQALRLMHRLHRLHRAWWVATIRKNN